jgi:penicillin amidase
MKSILRLFFITIFLAIGGFYYYFSPTYASELHYNGETITIFRNENNIPNIYAPSRESYFYAIGRVHAEDRLFQMTFKRLIIQGRLS